MQLNLGALGLNRRRTLAGEAPVNLQYIPTNAADAPLILFGQITPEQAGWLLGVVEDLAAGRSSSVILDPNLVSEPGQRVSFEARVGRTDEGVRLLSEGSRLFRCVLRPATWAEVAGLLEPFCGAADGENRHQYLSRHGDVAWVVSTGLSW